MKKTIHVISHSHWDREWYMPFEKHRMYLVSLIDDCLELFDNDPEFRSFYLDGQTIVLDDYLQIRPEKREKVEKAIRDGRFIIGPWYILQDEFLTSPEANVRNLLTGLRKLKKYGGTKEGLIGYFPDAFGNAGQMPQLLKQGHMEAVAFGRGVKPVGFNNRSVEGGSYESRFSEMVWESMDGSALLGILFANWYNNGAEIPEEETAARKWWDQKLADAENYAGTSQLLFMNGCDHQPVQKNLSAALRTAGNLYPDLEFIHSDFPTYVQAVKKELEEKSLSTVTGELTSQETDGKWTLANTASTHPELKIKNRTNEMLLESMAEPLSAMAWLSNGTDFRGELNYAWEILMQNHPHDSICCCSDDAVMKEMDVRFDRSIQMGGNVVERSARILSESIAKSVSEDCVAAFTVTETAGKRKREVVTAVLDIARCWENSLPECYRKMEELILPPLILTDREGNRLDALIEDAGVGFGFTLPDDRFRQRFMARKVKVTFETELKGPGYETFFLKKAGNEEVFEKTFSDRFGHLENKFLSVDIAEDGSLSVTEKEGGTSYKDLCWFEDTGDAGNEYIYIPAKNALPLTTKGQKADIRKVEENSLRTVYEIRQELTVPKSGDGVLDRERASLVDYYERTSGRSEKTAVLKFRTTVTLERTAKGVLFHTEIENNAKDHRVRVMFPTGLKTETHYADSVFEVVKRNNRHPKTWENPCGCDRCQQFTAMEDSTGGIALAGFGIYEYEVLPDEENTIALTLLRCTGEMGDWGVFPTETSQMQGTWSFDYEVIPFGAGERIPALAEARSFQSNLIVTQLPVGCATQLPPGSVRKIPAAKRQKLPLFASFLRWSGDGLSVTAFKLAEEEDALIVRFRNDADADVILKVEKEPWMESVFFSSVLEERIEKLEAEDGRICRNVKPYEIITLRMDAKGERFR